jgi:hypothetical protein
VNEKRERKEKKKGLWKIMDWNLWFEGEGKAGE